MNSAMIILLLLICMSVSATSEIVSKNYDVAQKNEVYTITATATLKGDFNRFVQRMMDVDNYVKMNVPYVVATQKILDQPHNRIVWFHTSTFLTEAKYYLGFDYTLGKDSINATFKLLPKSGDRENNHDYEILSGKISIKIVSGESQNCTYTLNSQTNLKFTKDAVDIPAITIDKIKLQADGGLQAFAK